MEPKRQFDRTEYVFKIWFNRSEKSSIVDVRLGSKYASVNITLHLTFFRRTVYRKLMKYFKALPKEKILRVHVKDKSCNSTEGLQLY